MSEKEPIAFVYQAGFLEWWAELFVEAPPGRAWNDNRLLRASNPPRPDGMKREDLALCHTRWGARRAAKKLKQRYFQYGTTKKPIYHEVVR